MKNFFSFLLIILITIQPIFGKSDQEKINKKPSWQNNSTTLAITAFGSAIIAGTVGYYIGTNDPTINQQFKNGLCKDIQPDRNKSFLKGFEDGLNEGKNQGFHQGKFQGFNDGFNDGFKKGNNNGFENGKFQGFNDGFNDGFKKGINQCKNECIFF